VVDDSNAKPPLAAGLDEAWIAEHWKRGFVLVPGLFGREVLSIHTLLINKPPGVDGRHPLHQDLFHFPFRPADAIIATRTAINPGTPTA
jgi:hypothetical protein